MEKNLFSEVSTTTRDTIAPMAPIGFLAATTTSSGEIKLSWSAVSDARSYMVYYDASIGHVLGHYGKSENVGNVTEVILTGLISNSSYHFSITALDATGNESLHSVEAAQIPI